MSDDFTARLAADQLACSRRFNRARAEYRRALDALTRGGDGAYRREIAQRARRAYDRAEDAARYVLACFHDPTSASAQHWTSDAIRAQLDAIDSIADAEEAGRAAHLANLADINRKLTDEIRAEQRSRPY